MTTGQRPTLTSRRRFLTQAAALGAVTVGSFPVARPAHAAATELRIIFPGGTWQEWFNNTFIKSFEQSAKVQPVWKLGLSLEPLVIAQRRRPQWDIIHENQNTSSQLGAMNAVVEWTEERIPNIKLIHPAFRYPNLVGKVHTPYGLAVNTKRIKRPVTAWADLWDPAFNGKVAFPSWEWMGQEVFHAINQINGGTPENVDPGINKLKELYKTHKAITINNVEHTHQLLLAEEVWICPHFGARVDKAAQAGAPVEFVVPKEGGLSFIWNTSIIAGRPKESIELAEKFVNTTLEAEKQIAFAKLTGYPPTNIQAMKNLPPDLKKLALTDDQVASFGKIQRGFDYMAMFAFRDQIRDRWNKEVLGS